MPEKQVDNTVFLDQKDLYSKKTKSVPVPDPNIGIDTEGTFFDNIINAGIASQLDVNSLNSFNQVSQTREQIYSLIDNMAEDSTIAAALELYTEGATETNDDGRVVWVESNDPNISKTVQFYLDMMDIDKKAYGHMYSLIKYGDLYIRLYRKSDEDQDDVLSKKKGKTPLTEDVKIKAYSKEDHYTHYIEKEPDPAVMFELTKMGKSQAYIKTSAQAINANPVGLVVPQQFTFNVNSQDIYLFEATDFVHAYLEDNSSRTPEEVKLFLDQDESGTEKGVASKYTVKRGQSLLYSIFKIWRALKLIENAILLNRVTKSSIVRAIGVEVGDMPKEMVGPHLQGVKQMMEQKTALDTNKSISEYTNPGPVENNIYIPTRNGIGALNLQQIGGDVNVSGLSDLDYFKNLFYGALGIPKQYMGDTDDGAGFNGGTSLSIISSVFAKRVKRFQNAYCQAITDACNLMLDDSGLKSYINKFTIKMQAPTTQEQQDRTQDEANKMALARDVIDILSNEVEDNLVKLSIIKELLANVITDPEVIDILQEYIDKLEEEQQDDGETSEVEDSLESSSESEGIDMDMNIDVSNDQDLDRVLGLEDETSGEEATPSAEETETSLPNPEELGIGDLTDNNNPEI